jgi:hypothetical protein
MQTVGPLDFLFIIAQNKVHLRNQNIMVGMVMISGKEIINSRSKKICPTKRAADGWDSPRLTGIFPASSFPCLQTGSTPPAHLPVTPAVGQVSESYC